MALCALLLLPTLAASVQAKPSYGYMSPSMSSYRGLVGRGPLLSPTAHGHSYNVGMGTGYGDPYAMHGHGAAGGPFSHSHMCTCSLGEVCQEDGYGRSYCKPIGTVGMVNGHYGSMGTNHGYGAGAGHSSCMYLTMPTNCLRPRIPGAITRYAFRNGYCEPIVASNVASWCRPRDQANIFRSRYACEKYCGM